jgi:hypothetical protein
MDFSIENPPQVQFWFSWCPLVLSVHLVLCCHTFQVISIFGTPLMQKVSVSVFSKKKMWSK